MMSVLVISFEVLFYIGYLETVFQIKARMGLSLNESNIQIQWGLKISNFPTAF